MRLRIKIIGRSDERRPCVPVGSGGVRWNAMRDLRDVRAAMCLGHEHFCCRKGLVYIYLIFS